MIVFHPLAANSAGEQPIPQPLAYSDAEGRFSLTTFTPGDGAPAGEYAVTVELRDVRQVGEEVVRDGPNLLPPEYANPSLTPQRFTVTASQNEVPLIRIGS
jgi:hypothetical protein